MYEILSDESVENEFNNEFVTNLFGLKMDGGLRGGIKNVSHCDKMF